MTKSNQLTTRRVAAAKTPGYYGDGGGLYLQVSKYETRNWVFRFTMAGKSREMGLGDLDTFSLKEARSRARDCRQQVADGIDPIEARKARRDTARAKEASRVTFEVCAKKYIATHQSEWRSKKHFEQWQTSLAQFAFPVLGKMPVDTIDLPHILRVLEPIWTTKAETASRVRGRIERVLAWAAVRKYRKGENPARWDGHLDEMLHAKPHKVKHLAALPFTEMPGFMAWLEGQDRIPARALEFCVLTAGRTGEVIGAKWDEINGTVWSVPASRMKGNRQHRVPLSRRAVALLERLPREGEYIFPGAKKMGHIHNTAMLEVLHERHSDATVHGCRSTFRDWAGDRSNYPRDVIEAALAHSIKDATEEAYRRSDALEKRARLMEEWARFCSMPAQVQGDVVSLHSA
jgi:integrase